MFAQYKNKILSFYRDHKRMPTYTEIMSLVGFKSKNAVYKLINKLVAEGSIDKDSAGRLIPIKLMGETPLLGLVEAGIPSVVEAGAAGVYADTVSLDDYLIREPDGTYLLEVKGDSMIDAGIREKDLVVAVRTGGKGVGQAKNGDIVIALVDGGWTMKYLRTDRKTGRVYLEPANKKYKPIYPEQELDVAAIVKGVVRRYR